jgi:GH24 family phage-related lysozyme (muramidase)
MVKYTPVAAVSPAQPQAARSQAAQSLAGRTVAPAPVPAPKAPEDVMAAARDYIRANEGLKNRPYKDSKGLWTVGIGHLMSPDEVKQIGDRALTDQEVNEMFARDLAQKEKLARNKLGAPYDKLPTPAKVAVLDGFFRGDMSGSPRAMALIRAGKLAEAADEYLNNQEYRDSVAKNKRGERHGVAGRMERNAKAIRAAAAKGPGQELQAARVKSR